MKTRKDLKIRTKQFLYKIDPNYEAALLFSESELMLLHHLFGRTFMLKTFLKARDLKKFSTVKQLLLEIDKKVKKVPIPKTSYQRMYSDIKKKLIKKIYNITHKIKGRPKGLRAYRKLLRESGMTLYFKSRQKAGAKFITS